jgi:hypothetical protein
MAEFILSAFSDEYASDFDEQIKGLQKNVISCENRIARSDTEHVR